MSEIAIKVENLSKQYRLGQIGTGTISHDLNRWWHSIRGKEDPYLKIGEANDRATKGNSEYVWALQNINFEVKQGEVLGIIGKNGAGKSTLLKILSKVTSPTTGSIKARGRIASLLEVGTGFHPEMTGRENIFMNGTIMGMNRHEIRAKLDEIVEFAGIAKYLDTPVKRYSSGMTVRLGFAIAAHLEPEILIVDEVLAVGDAEFQKKAIGKMQDVSKGEGRTVLFVSHNMSSITKLCTRSLVMEQGKVSFAGDVLKGLSHYMGGNHIEDLYQRKDRKGNGSLRVRSIEAYALSDGNKTKPQTGHDMYITFLFEQALPDTLGDFRLDFRIDNNIGVRLLWLSTDLHDASFQMADNELTLLIPNCPLNEGRYFITHYLTMKNDVCDWVQHSYTLDIEGGQFYRSGRNVPKEQSDLLINFEICSSKK
ncbi:ABC transporter ATP-binding protein [Reichenbachiella carrageenanivorans]|uniref:ABC transporter ATP-binding protein n=1 Tax=Reichenbachiella carrageenanivorans TaxID=2979869 RepID=A0ABY6D4T2_9BACT|nr:ABC transporter ATP-binding protein [Reichenbachiella carrageenanivorans]UXX81113.1 ABC transporter ATP-binding protein [Reichenbachiella carrageenanivorans]